MLSNIYIHAKTKRWKKKNEEVVNKTFSQILEMYIIQKNFGSDQGLVSGCAGCVGGNVAIGSGCTLDKPSSCTNICHTWNQSINEWYRRSGW